MNVIEHVFEFIVIKEFEFLQVEHKFSVVEENVALCGGAFTDDIGSGFFTTGYDRRDIICYAM